MTIMAGQGESFPYPGESIMLQIADGQAGNYSTRCRMK